MQVNRKSLLENLQWAQRFADREGGLPTISNVLFDAEGDTLTLTGTDLETAGVTTLTGTPGSEFGVAVPAKQLIKYLGSLSADEVELSIDPERAHVLIVTAGSDKLRVLGVTKDSYPELPTPKADAPTAVIGNIGWAVTRVGFAISTEESRFTLNGALLHAHDYNEALLVATDGCRLSLAPLAYQGPENLRVLLPRFTMNEAAKLGGDITLQMVTEKKSETDDTQDPDRAGEPDGYIHLTCGNRRITARKMTGNFPDYERVMSRMDWPNHVLLPAYDTLKALDRVSIYADERSHAVKFNFSDGVLRLQAQLVENGEAESLIPLMGGQMAGSAEIAFNANYIQDFLRANGAKDDTAVAMCWTDHKSMALLASEDRWLYGVMPMRVN